MGVNGVTRRDFVKGAAVGGIAGLVVGTGGTVLLAPGKDSGAKLPKWDKEADVIIAGAGLAGMSAAIAAADAGASVLVLEKMSFTGGAGALCSGTILAAGTRMQEEKGLVDSPDIWYQDIMATSGGGIDPEVARAIVDNALDAYNLLVEGGMKWSSVDPLPGYTVDRCYRQAGGGKLLVQALSSQVAKRQGITTLLDTKITKIHSDGEQVVGVEIEESDGKKADYGAKKAVILCTGDYSANLLYMEKHFPELKGAAFCGHAGDTGDGIVLGQQVGADKTGYFQQGHPHCVEVEPGKAIVWCRYDLLSRNGLILVNRDGLRFCDEVTKGHYTPLLPEVFRQPDRVFAAVIDSEVAANIQADERFSTNFRGWEDMFLEGLAGQGNIVKQGATPEELAEKLGVDPAGLKKAIEDYNKGVDEKNDAFGRPEEFLVKLETPPFYGWRGTIGVATSMGGLRFDGQARILTPTFEPIPRLYGAGSNCGGYSNAEGYRSGLHVANALVFGLIAGRNAAAEEPRA